MPSLKRGSNRSVTEEKEGSGSPSRLLAIETVSLPDLIFGAILLSFRTPKVKLLESGRVVPSVRIVEQAKRSSGWIEAK